MQAGPRGSPVVPELAFGAELHRLRIMMTVLIARAGTSLKFKVRK
jgi:hypothetical protein